MGYSLEDHHKTQSLRQIISQKWKPWRKALSVQRQTLSALIFRESKTRFGEQSLGMIWAFGEVLSHIFVFWGIWTILGRQSHDGLLTPIFLISGMVPYFLFRNVFTKTSDCISGNQSLLVFSQIHILDFALARCILELMIYSAAILFFITGLYFFQFEVVIFSIPRIIWGVIVIWLLGLATGLIYLPFKGKFKIVDTIIDIGFRILYFTSGVMFPLDNIPQSGLEYLQYNPILHIIEYIRTGFVKDYGHFTDIYYSVECVLFLLMIGLILLKRLKKMVLNND